MRMMMKASLPVDTSNAAIKHGSLPQTLQAILAELKPEAAYFTLSEGKRTAYIFFNMTDSSQLPAVCEPWFLAFDASIEVEVAMNAEDLAKATPGIEHAVKKFGSQ